MIANIYSIVNDKLERFVGMVNGSIWDVNMDRVIPVYLELALRAPRSIEYYKSKLRGTTARRRSITDDDLDPLGL